MTTPDMTVNQPSLAPTSGANFLPWINRGLESIWLFAALSVPLIFLSQDYAISEAKIAYIEVPKVALLRFLAGIAALLWLFEWAIIGKTFQNSFPFSSTNDIAKILNPLRVVSNLTIWIKMHPTRWLVLAASMFFGSTVLSTIFSGSFINSMWGEIPGQDGYSAYTIASYGVLFSVIATHVKSRAQIDRLLSVIVLMGFLVALYGTFQYYGHDFLGTMESTGGGESGRVTIFMGNAIFAGAVLSMTIPVTLVSAAANLKILHPKSWGHLENVNQSIQDSMSTFVWAAILSVQFLGLIFTFSRGPWIGAAFAIGAFLVLLAISSGLKILIRTTLIIGLACTLSFAFLHWQENVSIINLGPWLGIVLAVLGLAATSALIFAINHFSRAVTFITITGIIVTLTVSAAIVPFVLGSLDTSAPVSENSETASQIAGKIGSIKTAVLDPGSIGGRTTHWKVSWELIKDRPWFEFDDLHLTSFRPFIGYGPDLFRYTYLLKSPAERSGRGQEPLPLEPDHAHNFFIHQTVEQGILGGVASLALFASVLGIGVHYVILRKRNVDSDSMYQLLLIGLVAIILGRFLEMMVGVARISDLTVLWILFGLLAALVRFDGKVQNENESISNPPTKTAGRRNRHRTIKASADQSFTTALIFRLAVVAWLVGGIGVVTWQKSINSVRASIAEGEAIKHFQAGNIEGSIKRLDKAIKLSPGVPLYYDNRANASLAYQVRAETIIEPNCNQQTENPYLICLGLRALNSNLESVNQQPFYFKSRVAAGNSALNLHLTDPAIGLYQDAANMVPNSYLIRNSLAEIQIDTGLYSQASEELDWSLHITGDSPISHKALEHKGRLLYEMGRYDDALQTLKHGLSYRYSESNLNLIHDIYTLQGLINDISYFDRLINENPKDAVSFFFRGLANRELGNTENYDSDMAMADWLGLVGPSNVLEESRRAMIMKKVSDAQFSLAHYLTIRPDDERYENALMIIGQRYLELGLWKEAADSFTEFISINTGTAASYKSRGDALFALMRYQEAIKDYDHAIDVAPLDSTNFIALGNAYAALGDAEEARLLFDHAIQLDSNSSDAYTAQGFLSVQTGNYPKGLIDLDHAIQISPTNHEAYFKKYKTHIKLNQTSLALENLNKAITLAPINPDYFYSRGILKNQKNSFEAAIIDFNIAIELNSVLANNDYQVPIEDFTVSSELDSVLANDDPRYAKPFVGRGSAYLGVGDPELALIDAQKALKLLDHQFDTPEWDYYQTTIDSQLADVHQLLGDAYKGLGQTEEALYEYGQASNYR